VAIERELLDGAFYKVKVCEHCGAVLKVHQYAEGIWKWNWDLKSTAVIAANDICQNCGTPYDRHALRETIARLQYTFFLFGCLFVTGHTWTLKEDMPPEELAKIINQKKNR